MKQDFIKKWSNWWILQKQGKELTDAFEKELDAIIKDEVAKNISFKPLLSARCSLVEIDREVLQMCVEMYQKGEKLTAIKWLIEEAKRAEYTFGIKWAHEYFQSIGLEAVEGNDR